MVVEYFFEPTFVFYSITCCVTHLYVRNYSELRE